MSVLTLDPKVFEYVRSYIETAAYTSEINLKYNSAISSHFQTKDIETESLRLVRAWAELNEKSYNKKYKTGDNENIIQFITGAFNSNVNVYQVAKYLHCLWYNIEPSHWDLSSEETMDLWLLSKVIQGIESAIINEIPDYKAANWSNI